MRSGAAPCQWRSPAAMTSASPVESGLWQVDFDPDSIVELLFGPIVFRALNGGEPFSADGAAQLAEVALRGLTTRPGG